MTAPDVQCFHIAIVVEDLDAAIDGYGRLLDADMWRVREMGSGSRFAYGSGSGQTWELIEVKGEGTSQFHQFRDLHGEGVQHVGFWTPDIRGTVERVLAGGAKLVSATADAQGQSAVQLIPQSGATPDVLDGIGIGAFLDAGFGGWRIEYIGKAGETFLRDWLADEFSDIIATPPHWQ
ncbi:MAG TPA: VOC family protein, partial [Dehalococcoidia bacterium]|nr:VOC family protein [Dehalococcoidia bacterium]